ncbi:hypothetical protein VTK73DRAFT_5108 [Phialemonium thermophilum]|uniref:Secreted protein n=1 Tax=Phialemonium thermophilum TaxID=223376 RepID=A0ABR3V3D3_9PEZI
MWMVLPALIFLVLSSRTVAESGIVMLCVRSPDVLTLKLSRVSAPSPSPWSAMVAVTGVWAGAGGDLAQRMRVLGGDSRGAGADSAAGFPSRSNRLSRGFFFRAKRRQNGRNRTLGWRSQTTMGFPRCESLWCVWRSGAKDGGLVSSASGAGVPR